MNGKAILRRRVSQEVEIKLSGEQVAELWWDLDAVEQAAFFNTMGSFDKLVGQLSSIEQCGYLSSGGKAAMGRIGEYAQSQADVSRILRT